jgi:hypothetical protein
VLNVEVDFRTSVEERRMSEYLTLSPAGIICSVASSSRIFRENTTGVSETTTSSLVVAFVFRGI